MKATLPSDPDSYRHVLRQGLLAIEVEIAEFWGSFKTSTCWQARRAVVWPRKPSLEASILAVTE